MKRAQLALGGLLLFQLLLILLVRSPLSSSTGRTEAQLLLPALAGLSPARVELQATDGQSVTLLKRGAEWSVEQAGGFPADAKKVGELLDDLKQLEVRRPVVSSSRYHKAFKVEERQHEGRVRIWDASGDELAVDLILGSSPNYRAIHVRRAGQNAVYEVRGLASHDVRPEKGLWIDRQLVDVPREQLVGFALTNAKGTIELARQEGKWSVVAPERARGKEPEADKLDALLRAATPLRLSDAAGPLDEQAHGLVDPAATVTLRWAPPAPAGEEASVEPQQLVLKIGGKVEGQDNQRYVARSGLAYSGTVWDSTVSKLLEQDLAGLGL